ncbi:heterokaryon incompatibility protein-domain-containing protein [Dactylonectria estremocensis]|uniref:Heterokaryon incompatibility protein-domain-containing protein n=1 Tax=Dactylonectria estremocensis TaxID=1079267 RepID=A0A9P9FKH4_9HYPO|nr:heterokaryon incompatibility protein-domain-containing protein [Dactylonectria estremocensis]
MSSKKDPRKDKPAAPHPAPKPHASTVKPDPKKALPIIKKVESTSHKTVVKSSASSSSHKTQTTVPKTHIVPAKSQAAPPPKPQIVPAKSQPATVKTVVKPVATGPCRICLELDYARVKKESAAIRGYAPALQDICRSAQTCVTCNIMYQAVLHCYPEVFAAASHYRVFISFFGGGENQFPTETLGLSVSPMEFPGTEQDPLRKVKDGWKRRVLHIYSVAGKPCPWPIFLPGTVPSRNPATLAEQVKSWMSACEKGHKECRTPTEGLLPKRVVQIIAGSKLGSCRVRLFEPGPSRRAPYICLSHCWGKQQILTTKGLNLEQHMREIPRDKLSATFQDAIEFSCRLGVEFLWIDSLCIIQDSAADWEQEAVKMASYYSNADLTIAASAAVDGSVGLFPARPKTDEAVELHGKDKQGRPYQLVTRTAIDHPFDVEEDEFGHFPLTKRGWVFQEHILSRRFLHFGARELVWECHSRTHCQCGMIPVAPRSDHATNQVLSAAKYGLQTTDVRKRRQLWYENVESMMNLDFTYVTDRLAATAGVATLLAKGYKGRYLAGLWEDSLVSDLCWAIMENGKRPEELRKVPSWSWGSVSGGLATLWCQSDLSDPNVVMAAQVIKIDCQPDPPSFLGSLTRGILTLEGKLATGVMTIENAKGVVKQSLCIGYGGKQETFREGWFFNADTHDFWKHSSKGAYVHLLEMTRKVAQGQKLLAIYLVLQPHRKIKGSFERIGLLRAQLGRQAPQKGEGVPFVQRFDSISGLSRVQIE